MRQRWLPVGVLAGALFLINVVARLIVRFGYDGHDTAMERATLTMLVLNGLICGVLAFVWGRREPAGRWLGDLAVAVAAGCLLTILVGPFLSAPPRFEGGLGTFLAEIWQYGAFAAGGALLGYLILTALGLDYRSQLLKRYEQRKLAKPRRVVRR